MQTPTPKQDAEALFNSMKGFRVKHSHVRKCAKLACDAVLKTYDAHWTKLDFWTEEINGTIKHWQQVKIELDNCGKQ